MYHQTKLPLKNRTNYPLKPSVWASEVTQLVKVLGVPSDDLSWSPRTHMTEGEDS